LFFIRKKVPRPIKRAKKAMTAARMGSHEVEVVLFAEGRLKPGVTFGGVELLKFGAAF
jgi:hypothetical protein